MKLIEPETVLDQALDMLARSCFPTRDNAGKPHFSAQPVATSDAKAPADDRRG
jgi:hypothetical protein